MARVEHDIEVNVPVHTAYNQWTQFEEFPRFLEGVEDENGCTGAEKSPARSAYGTPRSASRSLTRG